MTTSREKRLIAQAASYLLRWDWSIRFGSFARLYKSVREYPVAARRWNDADIEPIEDALDSVSIWYWKRVMCLQRSCCLAWMLRDAGVPAQVVIGAQQWPPRTHAWVTVDGTVVGDMAHQVDRFDVIDVL